LQNLAQASHWSQERGRSPTKHRRYIALILLATSDSLSDWVMRTDDICNLTPTNDTTGNQVFFSGQQPSKIRPTCRK
jgi:hypothetical protein